MAFESTEHAQAYWKENLGIMGSLLAVWFWCLMALGFYLSNR